MILTYGDTSKLCGHWYILEFESGEPLELVLRRTCQAIPRIFDSSPIKIFAPIDRSNGFSLRTGCCIYVQSNDLQSLKRLQSICGVVGLMKQQHGLISVSPAEVADLIEKERNSHEKQAKSVQIGSFVRVLDGCFKNYRGRVIALDRWCRVEITTETGIVRLKTLPGNLSLCADENYFA